MVLCDKDIQSKLDAGQLIIRPRPLEERFTTSAVDLTLGKEFQRWKPTPQGSGIFVEPGDPNFKFAAVATSFMDPVALGSDGTVSIGPKEFLVAITEEYVELPPLHRIAARVEGKSTLARLGLGVHLTAPTIHLGFRGKITLEVANHGPLTLKLRPGMPICQLIFEEVSSAPSREMTGSFQDQETVKGR